MGLGAGGDDNASIRNGWDHGMRYDVNQCHTHWMEIDSERSLDTLSTEASTEWRREKRSNAQREKKRNWTVDPR
jgi:hypothetical protein